MKAAPIMREMAKYPQEFEQLLVHTGQHYDDNMSKVFFEELELPQPDIYLGVGSGSHAQQTARVMLAFEPVLLEHRPDWVIVVGDVNSTVACALTAAKLGVKVAHVEAGLRSFDRTMPEEYNRLLTDHIADLLFTTEPSANENLRREGIPEEKVHFVGNVMIDTLLRHKERALAVDVLGKHGLAEQGSKGAEERGGGDFTSAPRHLCTVCPVDAAPPVERGCAGSAGRDPGRAGSNEIKSKEHRRWKERQARKCWVKSSDGLSR